MAAPVNGSPSTPGRRRLRLAALIVAAVCVLVLAAGVFALSYPGARDTALNAGVSADLARIFPGIFDAVLLVACAAALSLRGAVRGYAWLVILVVIAAVAVADATHAMSVALPRRPMEATVAVVPWAVLLIGFTLLYALVRQARPGHTLIQTDERPGLGLPAPPGNGRGSHAGTTVVPLSELLAVRPGPTPGRAEAESKPAPTGPAASRPTARPAISGPATEAPASPPTAKAPPANGPATKTPAANGPATNGPSVSGPATNGPAAKAPGVSGPARTALPERESSAIPPPAATPKPTTAPETTAAPEITAVAPSDTDTEPSEPTVGFSRLHSSPTPPGDAPV
jgi:hypothetical protein